MFTGIIQGQGEIVGLRRSGQECRMEVRPLFPLENIVDGESIAHNGACLSVERHSGSTFTVYASGESLSRTTLGDLRKGDLVNLERALALGDRLGGHLVSGHVDCVATVRSVEQAGSSLRCTLAFPPAFAAEVIEKGSVTLDGISLTVAQVGQDWFSVSVIPHTASATVLGQRRAGDRVNLECDIIGKYVEKLLRPAQGQSPEGEGITLEFLAQNGIL